MNIDYIKGIFDGEGCISISRQTYVTKENKLTKYFYLRSNISNKNMECLRMIRDFLGYGTLYFRKQDQIYILHFNEKETVNLLDEISEGLIVKKEEARLVKQFMEHKDEMFYIELRNRRRGHKIA